jgi:5-methylcytosine-specific restriction endonuclease McrA
MRIANTYLGTVCRKGHDGLRYVSGHCVECEKSRVKKQREENREKCLEVKRKSYIKNRDKILQYQSEYKKTERGALAARLASSARRAKKQNGNVCVEDINKLFELQKGLCVVCKTELSRYHVDHVQPLSRGGEHNFLNLQLLCPSCNQVKFNKDPVDFMQSQGYLL